MIWAFRIDFRNKYSNIWICHPIYWGNTKINWKCPYHPYLFFPCAKEILRENKLFHFKLLRFVLTKNKLRVVFIVGLHTAQFFRRPHIVFIKLFQLEVKYSFFIPLINEVLNLILYSSSLEHGEGDS